MYAIMSLYRFAEVPRTKTTTTNNMPRIRCIWKCNLKICIATEKLNNTTTKTVITLPKCKQCHKQPHQIGTKTNGKNEAAPAKPRAEKQDAFLFLTFSLSPPPPPLSLPFSALIAHCRREEIYWMWVCVVGRGYSLFYCCSVCHIIVIQLYLFLCSQYRIHSKKWINIT